MNSFHTRKSQMQKLAQKLFFAALIGLSGGALVLGAGCSADHSSLPPPPATSFSANPPTVQPGGTTTLTWTNPSSATGAQTCTASETDPNGDPVTGSGAFTGSQATSGSFDFTAPANASPGDAYTFTLICSDANGASTARTVSVPITGSSGSGAGPTINFSATPSVVDPGATTQLAWSTSNAQSCTSSEKDPSGDPVTTGNPFTGSQPVNSGGNPFTVTLPNQVGSYTFNLTCTTSGGAQTSNNLTVLVQAPPPTISDFKATPPTLPASGGDTNLTWNVTGAQSCTASQTGTSSPAFTGTQPLTRDTSNPFTTHLGTQGTYTFTLTCESATGAKSVSTVSVPVGTVQSLQADPNAFQYTTAGGNFVSTLTWNHPEASACTASSTQPKANGDAGGPALTGPGTFSGSVSPTNGNFTTPQQNLNGTYTYTLTCTNSTSGAQTTESATVTVSNPDVALAAVPNTVEVGKTVNLSWNHPTAASCTASEVDPAGNAVSDFTGSVPVSSNALNGGDGFTTQGLSTAGIYTFKLACTPTGSTNPVTETATVTVLQSTSGLTGLCLPSNNPTVLVDNPSQPSVTFSAAQTTTGLCLGCSVSDPDNAVDTDFTNLATINAPVSLLGGTESLTVSNDDDSANHYHLTAPPTGKALLAGFVVKASNQALGAGVLQNLTIATLDNGGVMQELSANQAATNGGQAKLKVLGLTGGTGVKNFIAMETTKPFNEIRINLASTANVNNKLQVFYACVAQVDAP